MSNRFSDNNIVFLHEYFIRRITDFFTNPNSRITSRYVLYFDSLDAIVGFEKSMKTILADNTNIDEMRKRFGSPNMNVRILESYDIYNDDNEIEYSATQIEFINENHTQTVVFIPDCDEEMQLLGDAFKNGIRNQFVDKQENKILFYLSVQNIASVYKTTENFQRPGLPLAINNVYEDLKSKISNVDGDNQKKTLLFALGKIMEGKTSTDTTLTEFAPIIKIVERKQLVDDDFHDLHLFRMGMSDLGKKNENLAINHKLFRDISIAIEDQEVESCLSGYMDSLALKIKGYYDKFDDDWDRQISFEEIQKNKKANQKKFKVDSIVLKDSSDNELDSQYYSQPSDNVIFIFTKNYQRIKQFYIDIKCTQKPSSVSGDYNWTYKNAKGTIIQVVLDRPELFYSGSITLVGGKNKKKFNLTIIVMNTTPNFFPDTFTGIKKKSNSIVYNFETLDYKINLGEGEQTEICLECTKIQDVPVPIQTTANTQICFECPEDESVADYQVKFLLDDEFVIESNIRFEKQRLRFLKIYELFNKCIVQKNTYGVDSDVIVNLYQRSDKFYLEDFTVAGKNYQTKELLQVEKDIIENHIFYGMVDGLQSTTAVSLNIPDAVKKEYCNICDYFKKLGTIPSLCSYSDELEQLYQSYIEVILSYLGKSSVDFQDKEPLKESIYALLQLGVIEDSDGYTWLSPMHPLSVCYQMNFQKNNHIIPFDDELYSSIGYGDLLPFIYGKNEKIMQAIKGNYPMQWSCYFDAANTITGEKITYYDKIKDYYTKFSYLFDIVNNSVFAINIVGIHYTQKIVDAIFALYEKDESFRSLSLEINYYFNGIGRNEFDNLTSPEYIRKRALKLFSKKNQDLVDDFCDWYADKVSYYANADKGQYTYAHITFCAIQTGSQKNKKNTISKAESGFMLNGLISDIPSSLDTESGYYKYGFGAENAEEILGDSTLYKVAYAYNELANCEEGSPVSRDSSLALAVQNTKSEKLKRIYEASNWVVFVEPKIDLDFFIQKDESDDDLIIIHYPDKNVTSSGYSSITVTKKSEQYINVIKSYLENKLSIPGTDMDIKSVIKNYNAYSGEWLMTFIKNNPMMTEEKISLVSAIKFCKEYFSKLQPEYIWVPIGLDEILRVTGSIGGTLTDCLFSKNALIKRGIIDRQNKNSDDLLMAGINLSDEIIKVTYIPVEVKHGKCGSDIKQNAHSQSKNTAALLRQSFLDDEDFGKRIDKRIYRNFMMQHVISNIEKMISYGIVEKDSAYSSIIHSDIRVKLMNDRYELLLEDQDDVYAFYFMEGKDVIEHRKNTNDGVIEITAPLKYMYEYLINDQTIKDSINVLDGKNIADDLSEYDLSDNDLIEFDEEAENYELETIGLDEELLENSRQNSSENIIEIPEDVSISDTLEENSINESVAPSWKDARVLIGKDMSQTDIYWEFGHKNLANRHLLITGSSGNGKTYSIQTMLFELAKVNVPAIIFDYTEGFRKDQLEQPFVEQLGDKIKEHFLYYEGVPINPFVRHDIDFGGLVMKEKAADVASRLADIFTYVYDFGDQQYSAIFSAALNGINLYGDNMNMAHFRTELEEIQETNKAAKTVISKMEPFFQSISFENNTNFDWADILYSGEAKVNIFQMTAVNSEMKKIIVELMLWDAWYYTKKHGNKEKPFVVVLDEAQNLSHKKNSPSAVILTEGRKFGWSAWFATQSLKILKDDEVTRLQQAAFKLYFKPTDEEVVKIAKQLDPTGEVNWISTVKELKKGQCVVVGDRIKNNGSFGGTQPTKVSVTAFDKRM